MVTRCGTRRDAGADTVVGVPDAIFDHPRLAAVYDPDPDRSDLDAYVALVEELGASRVLDGGHRGRPAARRPPPHVRLRRRHSGADVGLDAALSRAGGGRGLLAHRFAVEDVRDAPDRPGREVVVVARRAG